MSDLPVLEWEPGKSKPYADVAEIGGFLALYAWDHRWRVHLGDSHESGIATSRDEAKAKARQCAKTLLRQVLEQLDRAHDPVTGLIVQVVDAEASYG